MMDSIMFNVCMRCGLYRVDKIIDPGGPYAICPECGFKHPFLRLPLFIVSGACGSGKSTVYQHLLGKMTGAVLLDSDILWRREFDTPDTQYRDFFETWLRMCKNISQSGRPVILFGVGLGVPANLENCLERRYFSTVHYLALTCSDEKLIQRLQARPEWRASSDPAFLDAQLSLNRWFCSASAAASIQVIENTNAPVDETIRQVITWFEQRNSPEKLSALKM